MNRIFNIILLMSVAFLSACDDKKDADVKYQYWKQTLQTKYPTGTKIQKIREFLEKENIEYSYVKDKKIIYAIDKDVNNWRIFYTSSILIRIHIDDNNTMKLKKSSRGYESKIA